MVRARWTTCTVAAGLGLICGCMNLAAYPWFGWLGCCRSPGCGTCEVVATPLCEGPVLGEGGPVLVAPEPPVPAVPPPLTPETRMPPLAPTPRLTPQPQPQSQPLPYTPTRGLPELR
jgi:hypothetical protein